MYLRHHRSSWVALFIFGVLIFAMALAYGPAFFSSKNEKPVGHKNAQVPLAGDFTLAVSWQPAFCETRPKLVECRTQGKGRFDAANFALHGLWPEPPSNIYCDVSAQMENTDRRRIWRALPQLGLSRQTRAALKIVMPGYASYLHRHEWIKHGTCSNGNAQAYYAASLALMEILNETPARDLFASNIGEALSATQIRTAFDQAFGEGAGDRVEAVCVNDGSRRLISELRIALSGKIEIEPDMGILINQASTKRRGCRAGTVDAVELQ